MSVVQVSLRKMMREEDEEEVEKLRMKENGGNASKLKGKQKVVGEEMDRR